MRVVKQGGDGIEIRVPPGLHWVLAICFLVSGVLALLATLQKVSTEGWELFRAAAVIGMAACAIAAGIVIFIHSPAIVISMQPGRGATIVRSWCFVRRREVVDWDEILTVELQQDQDSEGGFVFKPILVLHSGKQIPLAANWSHNKPACESATSEIRALLDRQAG